MFFMIYVRKDEHWHFSNQVTDWREAGTIAGIHLRDGADRVEVIQALTVDDKMEPAEVEENSPVRVTVVDHKGDRKKKNKRADELTR
jgi:hypothetical protein